LDLCCIEPLSSKSGHLESTPSADAHTRPIENQPITAKHGASIRASAGLNDVNNHSGTAAKAREADHKGHQALRQNKTVRIMQAK